MAILLIASPVTSPWSLCAFESSPKIPTLVKNISTTTAGTKYNLNSVPALFQLLCNQTVATILPTSRVAPIMIIGIGNAEKIATKPVTE